MVNGRNGRKGVSEREADLLIRSVREHAKRKGKKVIRKGIGSRIKRYASQIGKVRKIAKKGVGAASMAIGLARLAQLALK